MKLNKCLKYIKSDLFRYHGQISIKIFIREFYFNNGFKYTFWFRLSKVDNKCFRLFAMFWLYRARVNYGIHISSKVQCGYGLYLGHGMNIVVNPNTVIGNNVNFSQFTTLGSHSQKGATIGDDVYIGPNVNIIGDKKIGSGCIIGAASVVTKDVEESSIVVGNPAKLVRYTCYNQYVNNRWLCD
ncbi:serine acetyltransferase [Vibrio chagasii]|uniref:serine O-acetyltransferase n=1 Tax=Vibrio chagasii TaxID=170679 RepID=UPI0035A73E62